MSKEMVTVKNRKTGVPTKIEREKFEAMKNDPQWFDVFQEVKKAEAPAEVKMLDAKKKAEAEAKTENKGAKDNAKQDAKANGAKNADKKAEDSKK